MRKNKKLFGFLFAAALLCSLLPLGATALAAETYAITWDGAKAYSDSSKTVEITEAEAGATVYVNYDTPADDSKFVAAITFDGVELNSTDEWFHGLTMPDHDVVVAAVLADRMVCTVDMSSGPATGVSGTALFSNVPLWELGHYEELPLEMDVDGDGTKDVKMTEETYMSTVIVEALEGTNLSGSYDVVQPANRPYSKITYIFPVASSTYTVTFDSNGGNAANQTQTTGTDGKLTSAQYIAVSQVVSTAGHPDGKILLGWDEHAASTTPIPTSTMPSIEYGADTTLFAVWGEPFVTEYDVWVGSTRVTSANQDDILGDGTAAYDPDTKTLTLNNPTITGTYGAAKIYAENMTLTVNGKAIISGADYGIRVNGGRLVIGGSDTKIEATGDMCGIAATQKVSINDGMVQAAGIGGVGIDSGSIIIAGGTVEAMGYLFALGADPNISDYANPAVKVNTSPTDLGTWVWNESDPLGGSSSSFKYVKIEPGSSVTEYDLWLGDTHVTSANQDDILGDGTAAYDPSTKTLTLNNPTISGAHENASIYSRIDELTISGDVTVSGNYYGIDAAGLVITGGTMDITGSAYGISVETLEITGGTVKAISTENHDYGFAICALGVVISGGEVTATSWRSGISATSVKISDGVVNITGDAGITTLELEISGGKVTATGETTGFGAGSSPSSATISGGTVTVTGPIHAIAYDTVEITGGTVVATASATGMGSSWGIGGSAVTIGNGITSVTADGGDYSIAANSVAIGDGLMIKEPEDGMVVVDGSLSVIVEADGVTTATHALIVPKETPVVTHTVTFDANGHGTAPAAQTVNDGEKATEPTEPTESGWTFGGWYTEAACTTAFDFSTAITADKTLYAKWTEESVTPPSTVTYTVTFDANGHGTAPAAQTVDDGATATEPAEPTESGWTFGGWYTEAACTTAFDFSTAITADKTLYAKWTEESVTPPATVTYTVTFDANGHGTAPAAQTVNDGEKATEPTEPTETGWTFGGWYTEAACTTAFDFSTAITADITLFAKWTEESVTPPSTVTYTVVGGGDSTWTKDSTATVTITVKRSEADETCFAHFTGVEIDGAALAVGDYDAASGSTIITLKASTLQALSTGAHTITANFDDGQAETTVTIKAADPVVPKTSDDSGVGLWMAVLAVSAVCLCASAFASRKRRYVPKH